MNLCVNFFVLQTEVNNFLFGFLINIIYDSMLINNIMILKLLSINDRNNVIRVLVLLLRYQNCFLERISFKFKNHKDLTIRIKIFFLELFINLFILIRSLSNKIDKSMFFIDFKNNKHTLIKKYKMKGNPKTLYP